MFLSYACQHVRILAEVAEGIADGAGCRVVASKDEGLHITDSGLHELRIKFFDVGSIARRAFDFFQIYFEGKIDDVIRLASAIAACESFDQTASEIACHLPVVVHLDDRPSNIPKLAGLELHAHLHPADLGVESCKKRVATFPCFQVQVKHYLTNDIHGEVRSILFQSDDVVVFGMRGHDVAKALTFVHYHWKHGHQLRRSKAWIECRSPSFPLFPFAADEIAWTAEILHEVESDGMFR